MEKLVFWRYGSKEDVWHLYASCPELGRASMDGTLCKGSVETAIGTGRQHVCPVCRARYDRENPINNTPPVAKPHEVEKPETKSQPPKPAEAKDSANKCLGAAVAVLALLCCFVWGMNDTPHTSSQSTTTVASVSEYSTETRTTATPRPTARPTATPKPTTAPVNEDSYTVYITRTGSKYHRSGCSYLKSKIAIEKKDAIAQGYTACSRCKP